MKRRLPICSLLSSAKGIFKVQTSNGAKISCFNSSMAENAIESEVKDLSPDRNPNSVEATIQSSIDVGAVDSTCNNDIENNNEESSAVTSDTERESSLGYAELMKAGSKSAEERDYTEAADCYSRALEIRVSHFGELSPECVGTYYKYGCALLRKAQEETDPLGSVPKKDCASQEDSNKDASVTSAVDGEFSDASVIEQGGNTKSSDDTANETVVGNEEEGEDESDDEDLADGDEDESDLDLAWKMLDVARAIVEKHSGDTLEKVDILSALAEVALEREDVETSLSDYLKALSILERLVEPDSRLMAELNFRICLCLEIGSKPEEAIPYCQKAISACKCRVQRLTNEVSNISVPVETSTGKACEEKSSECSSSSPSDDSIAVKRAEIETLTELCSELEKKLEDLQQLVSNPKSILSGILGFMSAKARDAEKIAVSLAASSSQIVTAGPSRSTSSTISIDHTNGASGVTNLGIVGRGVKRVVISSTTNSPPPKKPSIVQSSKNDGGSTS